MSAESGRPELERDIETLQEMLVFAWDEKNKPQAIVGEHDDLVMAQAIALFAADQDVAHTAPPKQVGTAHWREDQWEDYYNASEADRLYLIDKWGRPEGL